MRLLHRSETGEFILSQDFTDDDTIPRYAILSHTWTEGQEVTFQEMLDGTGQSKTGYEKIRFCGQRAASDGLRYFWVDTCCIDKSSSAELTEAINSMFRWYQKAERCYVYLPDVSTGSLDDGEDTEFARRWKPLFRRSRWFSRGWTLQELIAPASVEFFSKEGQLLGNKRTLEQTLHEITRIAVPALQGGKSLSRFSVKERMSWAKSRQTKRAEDKAYCLLGIFGIQMPLIYGEGQESALVRLQRKIEKTLKDKPWSKNEKERQLLLSSLRFDQLDSRHANIKNAHTKTCEWLLKQSEYLDWLDPAKLDQHHGFLWIKGNPGTGKSTLMKYAFSTARRTMKDWIVISFFFSARGADLEKSTIGTYQSLLLQLLERIPALQDVFDLLSFSVSIASTTHQWSIEELKTLLEEAVQGLGENPVMCFIDALDECEEDQIRDMISFFERIGEITVSAGIKFQVCFSSRHYPHVNIRNNLELVLDGQEGHSQDITNYIDSELKVGRSRIAEQTRKELQEKASGIFMWVVLVVGILNKEYDGGRMHALQRRLREIPGDLHELLRDILTRDSRDQHELILCVQWVLFARQPLSPEELYFAVLSGVEPDALSRWEPDEIPMDVMKRFVLSSSKGLVEITKTNSPKAQFIHESVKDLLIKGNGLVDIWPDLGHNFEGQSHERLKHCSLNYINIGILTPLAIPNNLPKASCQEAADLRQLATGAFPFLEYAVHNVLYHAEAAGKRGITQESFINDFPLIHWIKLVNLLAAYEEIRHSEDMSLLYVLAERNMTNLIKAHPSILAYLEVGNERYGPPLLAALRTGSREAVRMFLEAQMADQPLQGRLRELYGEYCHKGSRQSGFGSHFNFTQHRTVPSYLLEAGESEIFTFLLEAGQIDVKPKDGRGRTTLSWAAEYGSESAVKRLLEISQADVDSEDDVGRTPLYQAAEKGNGAIVKLLLDTCQVDVNSASYRGRSPLSAAAGGGHEAVVKLLIETGRVDVNLKDNRGRTPLWYAASRPNNGSVVQLLLSTSQVEVNGRDTSGLTPLLCAASEGNASILKLLIEKGQADVNSKDNERRTALWWAASRHHGKAVVQLLLDTGQVVVDARNKYGQTPLSRAAELGNEAIFKLLVETGRADVNSRDNKGRTPLMLAARNGHEARIKCLLNTGM